MTKKADIEDFSRVNASSVSDSESETSTQEVTHNNGHDFGLIMKHITKLEAENARLQALLNNETSDGMNQQAKSTNKRRPIMLDDTFINKSKVSQEKKKSKHIKTDYSSEPSSDSSANNCKPIQPIPKPKADRKYLDIRKTLNLEKEKYNSYREALRHQVGHNLKGNHMMFKELYEGKIRQIIEMSQMYNYIDKVCKACPNLQQISFENCGSRLLDNKNLEALLGEYSKLKSLTINGSERLSPKTIAKIPQLRPSLEMLEIKACLRIGNDEQFPKITSEYKAYI